MGRIYLGNHKSEINEIIKAVEKPTDNPEQPLTIINVQEVIKEVFIDQPVYIDRIVYKPIEVEKIVTIEVPKEVIKVERIYIDRPVEVIREVTKTEVVQVEKFIDKEIKVMPKWAKGLLLLEALLIIVLAISKLN